MADVVNLRMVRKAKRRVEAKATADTNRAAYGQTKAERFETEAAAARLQRDLNGAKRQD